VTGGGAAARAAIERALLRALFRSLSALNALTAALGMLALVAASLVLSYSVFSRYFFKAATDWQDEVAVFAIVGAVFLSGAWVQAQRGHVGIDAVIGLLPARVNRVRAVVVDVLSLAFCAFFAWKSWTLFLEAWVDKMTTSSTFAPPLTIPYGMMAAGMTLLACQLLLQSLVHFTSRPEAEAARAAGRAGGGTAE